MSAHIDLDLAVAAARTAPGAAVHGLRRDFLLINDILVRVVRAVQRSVGAVSPYLGLMDRLGGRGDEHVLDFSVRRSREEAWHNAVVLAGQAPAAQGATIDLLDVRAAVLARLIARPGGLLRPALELIRLTESQDVPEVVAHLDRAVAPTARARPGGRRHADTGEPEVAGWPAGQVASGCVGTGRGHRRALSAGGVGRAGCGRGRLAGA